MWRPRTKRSWQASPPADATRPPLRRRFQRRCTASRGRTGRRGHGGGRSQGRSPRVASPRARRAARHRPPVVAEIARNSRSTELRLRQPEPLDPARARREVQLHDARAARASARMPAARSCETPSRSATARSSARAPACVPADRPRKGEDSIPATCASGWSGSDGAAAREVLRRRTHCGRHRARASSTCGLPGSPRGRSTTCSD